MIVVDTNIVFPFFVKGVNHEEARELYDRDPEWVTHPFQLLEMANVLATHERNKGMTPKLAAEILISTEELFAGSFSQVMPIVALETARSFRISVYDALFLSIAISKNILLVTQDRRLRNAAPNLTLSLAEALVA